MKNMIRNHKFTLLFIAVLFSIAGLCSCSSLTNIAYFQDVRQVSGMMRKPVEPFKLRPGDKINIVVNSEDNVLASQFTLTSPANRNVLGAESAPITTAGNVSYGNNLMLAYTVDDQGDIFFPVLGKISVAGMTRLEVAELITECLRERDLVRDALVTVEYVNISVDVLGEVNRPGRLNVQKDYFTILDAISQAGDLTINGERENILVTRNVNGRDFAYEINLCSMASVLQSDAYYLQQGDVVYVAPNKKRIRDAKSTTSTFQNPSFWVSLVSVTTAVVALITKL